MFPERFKNVTNGVTQRRWLLQCNPDLAKFITVRIGNEWITDFAQIEKLLDYATDPESQEELMSIKQKNKQRLIDYLATSNHLSNAQGEITENAPILDVNSLFDVQIKRVHEYKRQLINILHVVMLYHEMLENPHHQRVKRTVIFGGKAAASYETAKDIIRFIYCVARKVNNDPNINNMLKVVYVENYNVSKAEYIIPAADISEQTSTAGTEASGTGNMKLAINGALTLGTDDGANIEMREAVGDEWWPFTFGASAAEISAMQSSGSYNPRNIYNENPAIRRAVDSLRDSSFATNYAEEQDLNNLFHKLLEAYYGDVPDHYFTLYDLASYHQAHQRVEKLYQQPHRWAEYVMHNIAKMGSFSADTSIAHYCQDIWQLQPCLINREILSRIQYEYREHDKCRIL
jgi:starch phosphorylase